MRAGGTPQSETRMTTALPEANGWRDLLRGGRAPLLALILLGDWLVAADALVVTTILPSVGASLSGFEWFGWTASAFLTGTVVAGACAGWLSERIGLRMAMALAGLVLGLGCALSALAPGMAWFMAGRVLQGIAGGWVLGLVYIAMATGFPSPQLPRLFALANSVWGVATVLGPLLGGLFADLGSWRGVFWLFAGQAALFAVATLWLIPVRAGESTAQRVPAGPLTLLTMAIAAVSAAGVVGSTMLAAALLVGGLLLLAVAIRADMRSEHGLLPAQLCDTATPLRAGYLVYFMTNAAGIGLSLYGPTLLRTTLGLNGLAAGYIVASEAVGWTTLAIVVSGAGERWQRRWLVIGPAAILIGVTMQAFVLARGSIPLVILSGLLLGGGFGVSYGFLGRRVLTMFSEEETARGSGAIAAVRGAGAAVGAAVTSIGANAAGFAALTPANAPWVALAAFGASVPFALWGLLAAIRVAREDQAAASLAAA
jgi:MFS family permease